MTERGPNKKVANSLVALSSAAVLAVYTAGYIRTRPAATRFAVQASERKAAPRPPSAAPTTNPGDAAALSSAAAASSATPPSSAPAPASPGSSRPAAVEAPAPAPVPVTETPAPAPAAPPNPVETTPNGDSVTPPEQQAVAKYKDGTYYGWGTSRHGDIQAAVVIEDGGIASATIAQCLTRYSCSVIAALPPEVAQRQSPDVDYVSGATQSADAFYYAVVEALSKAR